MPRKMIDAVTGQPTKSALHYSSKYNQVPTRHGTMENRKMQENLILRHVAGCWSGKWLRFDSVAIAKQVMPLDQHHLIFTDFQDLQARFPGGTRALWELGRRFDAKNGEELWASLMIQAYDPAARYAEILEVKAAKARGENVGKIKRYKRRINYHFVYDEGKAEHTDVYARLTPQACALVDILTAATYSRSSRIFGEGELKELIETNKHLLYTKQDPWRIRQYYRGTLINKGLLRFARDNHKE